MSELSFLLKQSKLNQGEQDKILNPAKTNIFEKLRENNDLQIKEETKNSAQNDLPKYTKGQKVFVDSIIDDIGPEASITQITYNNQTNTYIYRIKDSEGRVGHLAESFIKPIETNLGQENEVLDIKASDFGPLYKKGEEVFHGVDREEVIIDSVIEIPEKEYLYKVYDKNGKMLTITESMLEQKNKDESNKFEDNSEIIDVEYTVLNEDNKKDIQKEIDNEIARIIQELNLKKSDGVMDKLEACCKLQKYIATKNNYDNSIMEQKKSYSADEKKNIELYSGVVEKKGVCTSYSIEFQEILSRLGIKVECVGLKDKNGDYHMANLVELDGEYYFFDTTLEQAIYNENAKNEDDLILCCAGLGSKTYTQFYQPQCIMPRNLIGKVEPLPSNIAESDIPHEIINRFINTDYYGHKR